MKDNVSAFCAEEYDEKIKKTLPYYEEFYRQVIDVVKAKFDCPVKWLDMGCGTGKMAEEAWKVVTISEQMNSLKQCGFKDCEIIWVSNMQAGLLGIKGRDYNENTFHRTGKSSV